MLRIRFGQPSAIHQPFPNLHVEDPAEAARRVTALFAGARRAPVGRRASAAEVVFFFVHVIEVALHVGGLAVRKAPKRALLFCDRLFAVDTNFVRRLSLFPHRRTPCFYLNATALRTPYERGGVVSSAGITSGLGGSGSAEGGFGLFEFFTELPDVFPQSLWIGFLRGLVC